MKLKLLSYLFFITGCISLLCSTPSRALEKSSERIEELGITQRLGEKLDLNLEFSDSNDQKIRLGDLISNRKPTILVPVYYSCPRLCGLLLNGLVRLLNEIKLDLGSDFNVVTVSFNHKEKPELARQRALKYYSKTKQSKDIEKAWHFLVGDKANVSSLMEAIGFNYLKDKDEYAHSAVLVLLTPEGEISRYFPGIDFSPWDVRLALVEASKGGVGSAFDQVLLYCFRFDHSEGKYTWAAYRTMQIGALLSILVLGSFIYFAIRKS